MMNIIPVVALAGLCWLLHGATGSLAAEKNLPPDFVYLRDVDPSIAQDIRYAGVHNFVGAPIDGYEAAECILTRKAAEALRRVQARLRARGLSLKVYDCYRPARAVAHFVRWGRNEDTRMKREFYPLLDKPSLFKGYIASRSRHSLGSTVDLTIVPYPVPKQKEFKPGDELRPCHLPQDQRFPDNSLDFGTGYDCFHAFSHTHNPAIVGQARRNRALLLREMDRAGFGNYEKEWWHFTLRAEPHPNLDDAFDIPIRPRGAGSGSEGPH